MTFSPQFSGQIAHKLSKTKKALIEGFKSRARVFGISSRKIILCKAAIIEHNISFKSEEEQRFHSDDSNKNITQSANSQYFQPIRDLKTYYKQLS